jgi:hypothetical protein
MEIGKAITILFESLPEIVSHPAIGSHVEKDRSGIADQSV